MSSFRLLPLAESRAAKQQLDEKTTATGLKGGYDGKANPQAMLSCGELQPSQWSKLTTDAEIDELCTALLLDCCIAWFDTVCLPKELVASSSRPALMLGSDAGRRHST